MVAERAPTEPDPLQRSNADRGGEGPQDRHSRARPDADQHVHHDGLAAFGEPTDEVQRAVVAGGTSTTLSQGRPREERRARHIVGGEDDDRSEAGIGLRVGDADHEAGVDREVGDDVDEPTPIGRADEASHRTIESIGDSIREPQDQRQPTLVERDRHAGPGAEREANDGNRLGTHALFAQPSGHGAQRPIERGPQTTIQHPDLVPAPYGVPIGLLPALLTLIVLFGGAIVGLVLGSLRPGAISGGSLGLADWRAIVTDAAFHDALAFTTYIAAASTLTATILAVAGAAALQHRPIWIRGALASAIPMPHLVAASLAVTWLAPGAIAERILGRLPVRVVGDAHGLGIIAVYVFKETPFLLVLVLAAWDQHTRDLDEAAAVLGAGRWARMRDIVLPRITPPLAGGALVVAAFTLGATEIPLLVGPTKPDTVATYALTTINIDGPAARARATAALVVVTAITLSLGAMAALVQRRRSDRPS